MEELIYITNFRQASAYIGDGVKPYNIEYDFNKKVMVFVFKKSDTKTVWNKWMKGEYKDKFKAN